MASVQESEIRSLLLQSYNPSVIPKLEEYLEHVCNGRAPYVFDAVRTLVKLYVLFPAGAGPNSQKYMAYAYILALQQHSNDLLALQYLIPAATQKDNSILTQVNQCAAMLDACLYSDFWTLYSTALVGSTDEIVAKIAKTGIPALQQSIVDVLALSYQQAPVAVMLSALHISDAAKLSSLGGIVSITDKTVTFAATPYNTKRQRVYQEGVNFGNSVAALAFDGSISGSAAASKN